MRSLIEKPKKKQLSFACFLFPIIHLLFSYTLDWNIYEKWTYSNNNYRRRRSTVFNRTAGFYESQLCSNRRNTTAADNNNEINSLCYSLNGRSEWLFRQISLFFCILFEINALISCWPLSCGDSFYLSSSIVFVRLNSFFSHERERENTGIFISLAMSEISIRDVFLSMQLPPVDELVATSKTGNTKLSRIVFDRLFFVFRFSNYSEITSIVLSNLYVSRKEREINKLFVYRSCTEEWRNNG